MMEVVTQLLTEIKKLKKRNKNVKGIKLTKNFGKENAMKQVLNF